MKILLHKFMGKPMGHTYKLRSDGWLSIMLQSFPSTTMTVVLLHFTTLSVAEFRLKLLKVKRKLFTVPYLRCHRDPEHGMKLSHKTSTLEPDIETFLTDAISDRAFFLYTLRAHGDGETFCKTK